MLKYKQIWHGIKQIRWLIKFNLTNPSSGAIVEQSIANFIMNNIQSNLALKFFSPLFNKLTSITSITESGSAYFTQPFRLISPTNISSVGLFLVNVSINKMS